MHGQQVLKPTFGGVIKDCFGNVFTLFRNPHRWIAICVVLGKTAKKKATQVRFKTSWRIRYSHSLYAVC